MRRSLVLNSLVAVSLTAGITTTDRAGAAELPFDVLSVTPVGSWQLRETTSTDHKGKQTVARFRISVVGEEERGGEQYVWIESEIDNFEIKKKKKKKSQRKKKGKTMLLKVLVKRSAMTGEPENVLNNLSGFGDEIIMQTGDDEPIKMTGGGTLAQSMLKGMGTKVNFETTLVGEEEVETPAGSFVCQKMKGIGSTEIKVVFKTIKVNSESMMWLSDKVPFGMVRATSTDIVNGKTSTGETLLLEFGVEGAVSKITREPKEMKLTESRWHIRARQEVARCQSGQRESGISRLHFKPSPAAVVQEHGHSCRRPHFVGYCCISTGGLSPPGIHPTLSPAAPVDRLHYAKAST